MELNLSEYERHTVVWIGILFHGAFVEASNAWIALVEMRLEPSDVGVLLWVVWRIEILSQPDEEKQSSSCTQSSYFPHHIKYIECSAPWRGAQKLEWKKEKKARNASDLPIPD